MKTFRTEEGCSLSVFLGGGVINTLHAMVNSLKVLDSIMLKDSKNKSHIYSSNKSDKRLLNSIRRLKPCMCQFLFEFLRSLYLALFSSVYPSTFQVSHQTAQFLSCK